MQCGQRKFYGCSNGDMPSFCESKQFKQTTECVKEAARSIASEFTRPVILNEVAFLESAVNGMKAHLGWGYNFYKIIPRPES